MIKKDLRSLYLQKRKGLSDTERNRLDDLLLIQFQKINLPFISTLLSYWPISKNNEPDTHLFTDFMEFRNPELIISYPKADFSSGRMVAIAIDEETEFNKAGMDIYEPADGIELNPAKIDMVFVPLLVADLKGYRVGYGKGFYDKYLAECRQDTLKIGFSYFDPVQEITDTHEFDVPLDLCITPQTVYVF